MAEHLASADPSLIVDGDVSVEMSKAMAAMFVVMGHDARLVDAELLAALDAQMEVGP